MEWRILAHYLVIGLKDYSLVDELLAGTDIHATTASRMLGKPLEEVTDDERQRGKTNNFGLMYGGGMPFLMRNGAVEEGDWAGARKMLEQYRQARPGLFLLREKIWNSYQDKGYVRLIDGARVHPESEHKTLNTLIQGSGARIKRRAFVACYKYLANASFKSHLINEVHDELQFDVSRGEIYTLVENIPRLMGNSKMGETIPLQVSIEYSLKSWADKQPWTGEIK